MNLVDNSLKNSINSIKSNVQKEESNSKYPDSLTKIALAPLLSSASKLSIIQSNQFIDDSKKDY